MLRVLVMEEEGRLNSESHPCFSKCPYPDLKNILYLLRGSEFHTLIMRCGDISCRGYTTSCSNGKTDPQAQQTEGH